MRKFLDKSFEFFASLKLAVILLVSLATVLAIGTFYEASHGTRAAHRDIYNAWFTSVLMLTLIMNLACAAIDRIPWKRRHIPFLTAHAGIIMLLMGAFITQQRGVDGTVVVGIHDTSRNIIINDTELRIFQSIDGRPLFPPLKEITVDFGKKNLAEHPMKIPLVDDDQFAVTKYLDRAVRNLQVADASSEDEKDKERDGHPALLFRIHNERVDVSEWIGLGGGLPPFYDLGPASISFVEGPRLDPPAPKNEVLIYTGSKQKISHPQNLFIAIYSMHQMKPVYDGPLTPKKPYATQWMNLQFEVSQYLPYGEAKVSYQPATAEDKDPVSAIETNLNGHISWFEMDSPHEIHGQTSTYFVTYGRKRLDLGFDLGLENFKLMHYGGSNMPEAYESFVRVNGGPIQEISMNKPLTYNHFTMYQSSFEQDDKGQPTASVFSLNYDPGRKLKYVGSIMIVGGVAMLFYYKPRKKSKK